MHFMLKATDHCNMNCTYCYVSEEQRRQNKCFPVEHMPKLFQQIFKWQQSGASKGELAFNWSGGEVLTLPMSYWEEVFRIQNVVYSKGRFTFKVKNGIQTNLTLLTDDYYELLHRNNVEIGTTIDGPRECMDKTRQFWDGSSVFDTVISKLKLLHGRVNLCSKTQNCVEYFFMVRWNGDVYPCNEFGGEEFEKEYCYGNLLTSDWHQIKDHLNRKALLTRHSNLKKIPRKNGGCKGCKYWEGCHGGCMHSIMRHEYRNLHDYSPQAIATVRDIPNCEATIGIYKYIEARLRENANKNTVPLLLHTDRISSNLNVRRTSFYQFHKDRWKATIIDLGCGPTEVSKTEIANLYTTIGNAKNILHLCCGVGSLFTPTNGSDVSNWMGVDYRLNGKTTADSLAIDSRIESCDDIMDWQGWTSGKRWDVILINPYLIYEEDLYKLLLLCGNKLHSHRQIFVYSHKSELQEHEKLEVTDHQGVCDYDKDAIAINVGGISIASLNGSCNQQCLDISYKKNKEGHGV